ncbi:xanthine dehydrogenase family protein molybdopterin-binding subunit [Actinoplanes solisilvae]|uniref:xanthine dehydrogenase family protein molybdopterin-binding subunit n=1 Tax=Actinoplanes solisilvae TaxID=2486853 RepID=UPI000FD835C9|nr:xanthine dehydrogenase family protein molybdopterin-binding subunit [Actinoplanes solisilvae]
MTATINDRLLGQPFDRLDGVLKATGAAPYPSDVSIPGQAHAVLLQSPIGAGRIRAIDSTAAEAAPGVVAVITHLNSPALGEAPMTGLGGPPRNPFTDDRVLHYGQNVAVVVAERREQAMAAALLVDVDYEVSAPILDMDDPRAAVENNAWGLETHDGDVEAALAGAQVTYDGTFRIAPETNNPIGLFTTVAEWDGDRLTIHDSTQWPMMVRASLAAVFGVPEAGVRVLVPYLGGGFGNGLRTWPHTILTALAARMLGRPVKLTLTRPQMFTSLGHRAQSRQRLRLGVGGDGRMLAMDHDATASLAAEETNFSAIVIGSPEAYATPNVATHDRQVRLNIPNPSFMRAPGHAEANFAIESALDELSYQLGIDPVELRLINHADVHPRSGLPWSSNALRECLTVGAEQFGWNDRNPEPQSMRDGNKLIGYGMAGVTFGWYAAPCTATITMDSAGSVIVRAAATDIGTGTYTVAAQLTADLLGLSMDDVTVKIGDSDLPPAPQSGGSGLAVALAAAVQSGAAKLIEALIDAVGDSSPLRGKTVDEVVAENGGLRLRDDADAGETFREILGRHGLDHLTAEGTSDLAAAAKNAKMATAPAFAARFVEITIDEDLGLLRVKRLLSVVDGGRLLNAKTARSQIIGGAVMGIGMAMFEDTIYDQDTGRIANATFGDYLVPVNADVPDLDVVFVGEPDRFSPTGVKGLGEVGVVGVAAAIANAVYHATGRRMRSLPITIDQLM